MINLKVKCMSDLKNPADFFSVILGVYFVFTHYCELT